MVCKPNHSAPGEFLAVKILQVRTAFLWKYYYSKELGIDMIIKCARLFPNWNSRGINYVCREGTTHTQVCSVDSICRFFSAFVNPVSTVWKAVVLKYMCLLVLVIKIILLVVCMYKL